MKVHVEVTQEDIKKGERNNSSQCMIALAITRATEGGLGDLLVGHYGSCTMGEYVIWSGGKVRLPFRVAVHIIAYDRGQDVAPFAFDLDLPVGKGVGS